MDDDVELQAIRDRLRAEMARPPPPAPVAAAAPAGPLLATDASLPQIVGAHRLVIVDCWAPWCAPCRVIGPVVDELAASMAGRVAFAKLNADENPRTIQSFGVMGLPTLLVFQDGRLVDRWVGALPRAELIARVERLAAGRARGASPGPRRL